MNKFIDPLPLLPPPHPRNCLGSLRTFPWINFQFNPLSCNWSSLHVRLISKACRSAIVHCAHSHSTFKPRWHPFRLVYKCDLSHDTKVLPPNSIRHYFVWSLWLKCRADRWFECWMEWKSDQQRIIKVNTSAHHECNELNGSARGLVVPTLNRKPVYESTLLISIQFSTIIWKVLFPL